MRCVPQLCRGMATFLLGRMSLSCPTQAAVNAHRADGDVRMPASSTRLLACRGTVPSLNSSSCHERSCFRQGLHRRSCVSLSRSLLVFMRWRAGRVTADDIVAVFGCGGVGLGAIAGSNCRGARTICVDVDDDKLEVARAVGGSHTINSTREPLHERLLELTGGRGPDVVIEAVGTPATFRAAVEEVAFTGRVVYIGYAKEPVSYETRLFVQKELDVLGSRNAQPEDFHAVIHLLESGKFPVDQAVSLIVPLEKAAHALRSWSENPSRFKKILVAVD